MKKLFNPRVTMTDNFIAFYARIQTVADYCSKANRNETFFNDFLRNFSQNFLFDFLISFDRS